MKKVCVRESSQNVKNVVFTTFASLIIEYGDLIIIATYLIIEYGAYLIHWITTWFTSKRERQKQRQIGEGSSRSKTAQRAQ